MNGRQLAEAVCLQRPDVRILFTSAYTETAIVHHGRLGRSVHLLSKSYPRGALAAKIRHVLDKIRDPEYLAEKRQYFGKTFPVLHFNLADSRGASSEWTN